MLPAAHRPPLLRDAYLYSKSQHRTRIAGDRPRRDTSLRSSIEVVLWLHVRCTTLEPGKPASRHRVQGLLHTFPRAYRKDRRARGSQCQPRRLYDTASHLQSCTRATATAAAGPVFLATRRGGVESLLARGSRCVCTSISSKLRCACAHISTPGCDGPTCGAARQARGIRMGSSDSDYRAGLDSTLR